MADEKCPPHDYVIVETYSRDGVNFEVSECIECGNRVTFRY